MNTLRDSIRDCISASLAVLMVALGAGAVQPALADVATDSSVTPGNLQSNPQGNPQGVPGQHRRGPGDGAPRELMGVLRQLDLSADQQQSVRTLLQAQRAQLRGASDGSQLTVLGNPGDPGYATAVDTAKQRAAARIDAMSGLQQQIYALLTPAQKAKLPAVLAQMQTKLQERMAQRRRQS
ncbi:MAG: Spy/CpxP family protein refolding chaperone [Steroidobacteraceae bacterium]